MPLSHSRVLVILILTATCLDVVRTQAVELVGYVPYYRMSSNYVNNMLPGQIALLDEVRYFGLSVNGSGAITSQSGNINTDKSHIATIKSIIEGLPIDERPRLNITLGGAGVDSVFSSIAASSSLRTTLAQNVSALLNETGVTSVDIDWEHPDASPSIERSTTYPALLKRIKQEIGPNKRVYATVDPTVMIPSSVLTGTDGIDGISLMTYDLGWWGNNSPIPPHGEHSLPEYVEDAVDAWTDPVSANSQRQYVWDNASWGNNTPAAKLGVGLPFYGKEIFNNSAYTYADLASNWTSLGDGYYSLAGQTVWIPDSSDIEARVQLAHDEGLQHIIIWEMAQDLAPSNPNSMLRIAADKLASLTTIPGDFNGDGSVDATDLAQWQDDFGVNNESDADGDGDSDGRDFLIWQRNFPAVGGLVAGAIAVPESTSAVLLSLFSCFLFSCDRLTGRCKRASDPFNINSGRAASC